MPERVEVIGPLDDGPLDDGPLVTKHVVERMIDEKLLKIQQVNGDGFDTARYGQAVALFTEVALADSFAEFGDAARVRAQAVGRGTALWSRQLRHPPQGPQC